MSKLAVVNANCACCIEGVSPYDRIATLSVGEVVLIVQDSVLPPKVVYEYDGVSVGGKYIKALTGQHLVWLRASQVTQLFPNASLEGKVFAITGALGRTREYYVAMIEAYKGTYRPTFSGAVTHLITDKPKSNTTKLQKARRNGTTIISEDEFWALIRQSKT